MADMTSRHFWSRGRPTGPTMPRSASECTGSDNQVCQQMNSALWWWWLSYRIKCTYHAVMWSYHLSDSISVALWMRFVSCICFSYCLTYFVYDSWVIS